MPRSVAPSVPAIIDKLSAGEAARILGVNTSRVWLLMKQGRIPAVETKLGFFYDREAVIQLSRERAEKMERAAAGIRKSLAAAGAGAN